MEERWLPVVGYEGRYEISSAGRVRSIDRMKPHRWGGVSHSSGKLLAEISDDDGYRVVNLKKEHNSSKMLKVHRLVLEAFVGPCPLGNQCLHDDDVRHHNSLENLSWGTPKRNMQSRDKAGHGPQGVRNPKAKLTPEEVSAIRRDQRRQVDIAADYAIDQTTVSNIKVRRTWAGVE